MSKLKVLLIVLISPFWIIFMIASLVNFYDLIFVPSTEWNGYQVAGFPSSIIFLLIHVLLVIRYLFRHKKNEPTNPT